jgi:Zn-dependent peptidase ImmA (M78 family)
MNPENYAIDLLNKLDISQLPIDPFDIANKLGIPVVEADAKGYEGLLLKNKDNARIIISKNIPNRGRRYFTLAHEIGHFSIPSHTSNTFECIPNPFYRGHIIENEANIFASELLLPERLIKPMLHKYKPDFESISELAEDCDTSLTATAIKFIRHTDDCCALLAISDNKIRWFQKSSSFPFWIERGPEISAGTLTASYSLKGVEQEPESQEIHASYWVKGKRIDNSTTLIESCVPMPDYGVVLTILWFPDPPFDISGYSDEDNEEYRYEEDENTWRWRDPEE